MATSLTPKENYLRIFRGEFPDWIPTSRRLPDTEEPPPVVTLDASCLWGERKFMQAGKDLWGVEFVGAENIGGATLPKPGQFILKDIRKWRDVVKAPDTSGWDWEALIKKDLEGLNVDRSQSALSLSTFIGFFQQLMGLMGFEEGLCAMYEEPEAVKEMYDYMCTFYCNAFEKIMEIAKPDLFGLTDDTAAERAPFISREMYKEFLIPLYDRFAKLARDRDILITMHNCGKAEIFFDDLVKIGVVGWNPAQLSNDILAVQAKFGRHLSISGAWEGRGRLLEDDVTDDEIRASVRKSMDTYGKNGGYIFGGGFSGAVGDQKLAHKNEVLTKEALEYGRSFYKK